MFTNNIKIVPKCEGRGVILSAKDVVCRCARCCQRVVLFCDYLLVFDQSDRLQFTQTAPAFISIELTTVWYPRERSVAYFSCM